MSIFEEENTPDISTDMLHSIYYYNSLMRIERKG